MKILTETLRPKSIQNLATLNRIKSQFPNNQAKQHTLLIGSPGTGKTSLAKILTQNKPTLYINISQDRGIDTVREQITEFINTTNIQSNQNNTKFIILDEIDGATPEFFKALRATMEKSNNTIFIATANYNNKIITPIQSRFNTINFNPSNQTEIDELKTEYNKHINKILTKLNIKNDNNNTSNELINKFFPDLRKIISTIQSIKINPNETNNIKNNSNINEIIQFLNNKNNNTQELITISQNNNLHQILFDNVNKLTNNINKIPQLIINIAEWEYKSKFSNNQTIPNSALIMNIQQILNS